MHCHLFHLLVWWHCHRHQLPIRCNPIPTLPGLYRPLFECPASGARILPLG